MTNGRSLSSVVQMTCFAGSASSLQHEGGGRLSCLAENGRPLNATLREFARLLAEIVVDELLTEQREEAASQQPDFERKSDDPG